MRPFVCNFYDMIPFLRNRYNLRHNDTENNGTKSGTTILACVSHQPHLRMRVALIAILCGVAFMVLGVQRIDAQERPNKTNRLLSTILSDIEAEQLFANANNAYKNAYYKQAATMYEQLAQAGIESAAVYFNLGNSYYKSGKIASAILNYHRAHRLDPTDDDIDFNLGLAESRIADKIDPAPQFFIVKWWRILVGLETASVWSIVAVVFVWILFIAGGIFFASNSPALKKGMFTTGIVALLLAGLMFVFAYRQNKIAMRDESAIVFATSVSVKSEPQEESKDLFVLHEGTHVEILGGDGAWCKIRIPDGSVGWLRRNTIEII